MISKIVSGGQTGVDRAALDVAIAIDLEHGGWCPKGRRAEDGVISSEYQLQEAETDDYSKRTRLNVRDSDGTLILYDFELSGGTKLTANFAQGLNKPNFVFDISSTEQFEKASNEIGEWIRKSRIEILNVAGPRESGSPGIYTIAFSFLNQLFMQLREKKLIRISTN